MALSAKTYSPEMKSFLAVLAGLAVLFALAVAVSYFWVDNKHGPVLRVELPAATPYVVPMPMATVTPDLSSLEAGNATSSPTARLPAVSQDDESGS